MSSLRWRDSAWSTAQVEETQFLWRAHSASWVVDLARLSMRRSWSGRSQEEGQIVRSILSWQPRQACLGHHLVVVVGGVVERLRINRISIRCLVRTIVVD